MITHASLFSGIGAPELAATWMGWRNVFHCEINPFCRQVLQYHYPNSISYDDITKTDFTEYGGGITVLTGGFPCQPFSAAGQRKGAEDDRYLWPEMLRAIHEIKPRYVVGENVAGLLSVVLPDSGVKVGEQTTLFGESNAIYERRELYVIESVCRDLEREGYSVQPIVIPACAVGAPHRRDRVWFLAKRTDAHPDDTRAESVQREREHGVRGYEDAADTADNGLQHRTVTRGQGSEDRALQAEGHSAERNISTEATCSRRPITDTIREGGNELVNDLQSEKSDGERIDRDGLQRYAPTASTIPADRWQGFPTTFPIIRVGYDGVPLGLPAITIPFSRWHRESIKALGNSMVPQVVYEIFRVIQNDIDNEQ